MDWQGKKFLQWQAGLRGGIVAAALMAGPAWAGEASSSPAAQPAGTSSGNATVNLIRLMVDQHVQMIRLMQDQKVITPEAAEVMIRQARTEADLATKQIAQTPTAGASVAKPGEIRVGYVPEFVRRQIKDEVKQEVMQTAKAENWAQPDTLPDWTRRIKFNGDFRLRGETTRFDNENETGFFNYSAINTASSAFDFLNSNSTLPPLLNSTVKRDRMRLRGRLGVTAAVSDDFTAALRIGTGENNSPVSMNQTLGNSGQPDFSKFSAWIDRFYLTWSPVQEVSMTGGRIPNPWFSTNLIWSDDLNFDGVAAQFKYKATKSFTPFFTVGAFPIENTAFNIPDAAVSDLKFKSRDKWLLGVQGGTEWESRKNYRIKFGAGYYYFKDIEGRPAECDFLGGSQPSNLSGSACPSDSTRNLFSQKGNSMIPLRIITNSTGTTDPQYFGLGAHFHDLALTGQFDLKSYDPIHVVLNTEFITNLAFNYGDLWRGKDTNNGLARYIANYGGSGAVNNLDGNGNIDSGRFAYMASVTVGMPKINDPLDWNATVGYKYIEADSLPDAFNDSDFHLGGTNAQGFFLTGNLGLSHNVWISPRWQSSREITSDRLSVDVYQVDLNARF